MASIYRYLDVHTRNWIMLRFFVTELVCGIDPGWVLGLLVGMQPHSWYLKTTKPPVIKHGMPEVPH